MNIKLTTGIFLLFFSFGINLSAEVVIKKTNIPPIIDGDLSDFCWNVDETFTLKHDENKTALNKTLVSLAWDQKNLYIAFKCFEKNMAQIIAKMSHDEERDLLEIFRDDCVEIFLDPLASKKDFYHIAINTCGVIYDAHVKDARASNNFIRNTAWQAGVNSAIKKHESFWTIEIAIPFSDFEYTPTGGEVWRINLCREQKPDNELSCLSPTFGAFASPGTFINAEFQSDDKNIGFMISSFAADGNDSVELEFADPMSPQIIQCIVNDTVEEIHLKPGQKNNIKLNYKTVLGLNRIRFSILNITANKKLYDNTVSIFKTDVSTISLGRTWEIENPLYEELFSKHDTGIGREGALSWFHTSLFSELRPFAKQYGLRYVKSEHYKQYAKEEMFTFSGIESLAIPACDFTDDLKESGHKVVPFAYKIDVCDNTNNLTRDITRLQKAMEFNSSNIWGFAAADEMHHGMEKRLLESFHEEHPSEHIRSIDREVKEKYGNGTFGIPLSENDDNPYRWIAFHKWISNKVIELMEIAYKTVKQTNPEIKFISADPLAFHRPIDFSAWKGKCDILTHQTYPRNTSKRAYTGFIVKLISDISGVEEIWPCLHVEHYAGNYTGGEVLEMCSQAFRNGATGFHWYLSDTRGRRKEIGCMYDDYFGAPERRQLILNVTHEIRKMKKLNFPVSDCAILYSCDTHSSVPTGKVTDNIEAAYTFLGPIIGGAIKFIDDNQIERNRVDLKQFKVIYIPSAKIQRKTVVEKLTEYVKDGGTIVCGDPSAFSFDQFGEPLENQFESLFGTKRHAKDKPLVFYSYEDLSLKTLSPLYFELEVTQDTTVIAKHEDGQPAITSKRFGKGEAILFSASPFTVQNSADETWGKFFRKFHINLGLKTDCEIWRFKFPERLIPSFPEESGVCLTGNNIIWRMFTPLTHKNIDTQGTYSYSASPDLINDQGGVVDIPFSKGDLTDRKDAHTAGNVQFGKSKVEDWIVSFSGEKEIDITFDFKTKRNLIRFTIWFSGLLPEFELFGSNDQQQWHKLGDKSSPPIQAGDDVMDYSIEGNFGEFRYFRLNLNQGDEKYEISEIEVWGDR